MNFIAQADQLLDDIQTIVRETQLRRYERGFAPQKRLPVVFKELPLDSELHERLSRVVVKMISDPSARSLYRKKLGLLLLLSAFCMVRYHPFSGGFWDTFSARMKLGAFRQSQLFERMWRAFITASADQWFRKPVTSWDDRRLLVHSIYREAKTISFGQIQSFFIRYYSSYDDMRAFDFEYDRWGNHPFDSLKEKDENRVLIRDTVEKLVEMFNFVEDSDLAFSEKGPEDLAEEIHLKIGINPLSMFSDAANFMQLIFKVLQQTITIRQFKRYLSDKRPDSVKPAWLNDRTANWENLLDSGIAYGLYTIKNRVFEVVPRIGMRLSDMSNWPYDKFFNPSDLNAAPDNFNSDIVAICRREPFKVTILPLREKESAVPFFSGRSHIGYAWVGRRRIGQRIQTDDVVCPVRQGATFLPTLKWDPRGNYLKVMISYIDFYNPEKQYASMEISLIDGATIWEGQSDSAGRRNSEIYESVALDPDTIPGQINVQLKVDDEKIGGPVTIAVDEHLLLSRYSNTSVSPGRQKFGETRFVLLTPLKESEIEHSDAILIQAQPEAYGTFNIYEVRWRPSEGVFSLKTSGIEWYFSQPQDIYFVSNFAYDDPVFEMSPDLASFATHQPDQIRIQLHHNLSVGRIDFFDFSFRRDGKRLTSGRLPELLRMSEKITDGEVALDYKTFYKLQGNKDLKPGSYELTVSKGRPASRGFVQQEIRFFILPTLRLALSDETYIEGEIVKALVSADEKCFWDDVQSALSLSRTVDLGKALLGRDYERSCRVHLHRPSISLSFAVHPSIFACRLNSMPIESVVSMASLKEGVLGVFGPSGKTVQAVFPHGSQTVRLDSNGRAKLTYAFFKENVRSSTSAIELVLHNKKLNFDLWWLPSILKFGYTGEKSTQEKLISGEAIFEIEVEGPPDSGLLARLMNNLGETCGESTLHGSGLHRSSVKWVEGATVTNTAVLKLFISDPLGNVIPVPGKELEYVSLSPKRELAILLKKANEEPKNGQLWLQAAEIAFQYKLDDTGKIIQWLKRSFENGVTNYYQLEKIADISIALNDKQLSGNALLAILRSTHPTASSIIKYLALSLKKENWDNNTDDAYRAVLTKGQIMGVGEQLVAFYMGCRTMKQGLLEESVNQFYQALEIGYSPVNEIYDLIAVTYFKKGEFWKILEMETPVSHPLRNWGLWVKNQDTLLKSDPKTELSKKYWDLLKTNERIVLMPFVNMTEKDMKGRVDELMQHPECIPALVTTRAAYRRMNNSAAAEVIHRKLIQINSRFESE